MLNRIHHNPRMSRPNRQVAGLRTAYAAKFGDPRIKLRRTRILIRETRATILCVDEVGAIVTGPRMARIHGYTHNCQPLGSSQRPKPMRILPPVWVRDPVGAVRPSSILLP